ncbi:unnamed protein product [Phytophthora lilii]|uniref:Unnamed protein product n=1 Tax=Phytophthora lilii TaxID=2077276 RepID=A0A9W6XEK3_9STRA|nr:unnamed protein product [Phytophthora lilii]
MFNGSALISSPGWEAFGALRPTESLYDFSVLSGEAIALGDALDANNAICQSGNNDWGSTTNVVSGTAQEVMNVIKMFDLSVAPQMMRELELGIEQAEECPSAWNMIAITRLFQYPTTPGDATFAKIPASRGTVSVGRFSRNSSETVTIWLTLRTKGNTARLSRHSYSRATSIMASTFTRRPQ